MPTKYLVYNNLCFLGDMAMKHMVKNFPECTSFDNLSQGNDTFYFNVKEFPYNCSHNFLFGELDCKCDGEEEVTFLEVISNSDSNLISQSQMERGYWYYCPENQCYYNNYGQVIAIESCKVMNNVSPGHLVENTKYTLDFKEVE